MSLLHEYIREAMEEKSEPTRMPLNIPIPADLRKISDMFSSEGQELYIVGGAVRDALLNKSPKDYDLATGAAPDDVLDIVSKDPGSKVDLTGKSFGVVRVWTSEGNEYEIATFRKDIGSGRRPDAVEFTSIEDDVKRRDLTINALFYDMDSAEVVDYVGGIEDIKSGVIKAVGDPNQRFQEDKLRILRAVRFAARMGSDLDPETATAIMKDNDLTEVSPERIRDELVKGITSASSVDHFLRLLTELDLYPQIFPGLSINSTTGSSSKDIEVQLALILSGNDSRQVKSSLKNMKYSNDEVDAVVFMINFLSLDRESVSGMKKEFNRIEMDPDQLKEFANTSGVDQNILDAFIEFSSAPPAVSAKELMSQGLSGPDIGSAIKTAEEEAYVDLLGEEKLTVNKDSLDYSLEQMLREYVQETMIFHTSMNNIERSHLTLSANRSFYEIKPHIFERDYVTRVLGIDLHLNESYPYSGPVYNRIVQEQKFLEDFFQYSDDQIWLIVEQDMLREQDEGDEEDASAWSWAGAKRLAGDTKTAAAAMKMMATDPTKIEAFVEAAMEIVKEPFENLKKFFEALIKKGKEWGLAVFEKIAGFAEKLWGGLEATVDKVNDLSGWKQALAAGAAVVAIKSVWGKWGSIIGSVMEKFNEFATLVGGETNESYIHSMGLVAAVYGSKDDELNEWNPFKKKDKWAEKAKEIEEEEEEEKGMTDEEKRKKRAKKKSDAADAKEAKDEKTEERADTAEDIADDPSSVVDKAVGGAEKKGGWAAKMGKEGMSDEDKEKGSEIIKWLKDKFIGGIWKKSKKMIAKMAARAAAAAATGGATEYLAALGKMYKNLGGALKTLRPAFQAAAEPAEIKSDIKDSGSEEEFWAQGTDEADKDKEKKKEKNEALLRRVVRESLIQIEA